MQTQKYKNLPAFYTRDIFYIFIFDAAERRQRRHRSVQTSGALSDVKIIGRFASSSLRGLSILRLRPKQSQAKRLRSLFRALLEITFLTGRACH